MTRSQMVDKAIEIIKLFKPSFYNTLTWTIVISGLGLIGTPFVEKMLTALLQKELSLSITEDNDSAIGITLVIIGLIYNLITVYLEKYLINVKKEEQKESPKKRDLLLFEKFLEELPSNSSIEFLRQHSFYDSFDLDKMAPLHTFLCEWQDVEHEFIDQGIEALKEVLYSKAKEFSLLLGNKSFRQRNDYFSVIPNDYIADYDLPKRVKDMVDEIDSLATQVYESHQNFVREAKKKFDL